MKPNLIPLTSQGHFVPQLCHKNSTGYVFTEDFKFLISEHVYPSRSGFILHLWCCQAWCWRKHPSHWQSRWCHQDQGSLVGGAQDWGCDGKSVIEHFIFFTIRKTLIVAHKQRKRQINTKVCSSKSAIVLILSFFVQPLFQPLFKQWSQKRFKLMLTTARSSMTTQRLNSFKYPPDQQRCSQLCLPAVHCARCHFLIFYTCAYTVSFSDQKTTVIGLGVRLVHTGNWPVTVTMDRLAWSLRAHGHQRRQGATFSCLFVRSYTK